MGAAPHWNMTGGGGGVSGGRAARVGIGIGLRFRGTDVVVGAESDSHRTLLPGLTVTFMHANTQVSTIKRGAPACAGGVQLGDVLLAVANDNDDELVVS